MHMLKPKNRTIATNQQGMAAIFVTTILIFVIGIIVLSFAQIVRREQRNALDDQLASQAYYAAESGVNLAQSRGSINKTDCGPDGTNFTAADYDIGQNASITCLLVSSELKTLEYGSVGLGSKAFIVNSSTGNIAKIYVSWETSDTADSSPISNCVPYSNSSALPSAASRSCKHPILRADLVPLTASTGTGNVGSKQFTSFFYPTTDSSGPITYSPGSVNNLGSATQVDCDTPPATPVGVTLKSCTAIISIPAGNQGTTFAMRLQSIYKEANITVFALDSGNTVQTLTGGQVLVDVTAKASDVLKRVQARIPAAGSPVPDFAISAGNVCKKYSIAGGVVTNNGGAACDPAL